MAKESFRELLIRATSDVEARVCLSAAQRNDSPVDQIEALKSRNKLRLELSKTFIDTLLVFASRRGKSSADIERYLRAVPPFEGKSLFTRTESNELLSLYRGKVKSTVKGTR